MLNDDFCSINRALSNGILEVKFTLSFYTETSDFLEETIKLGRSYHPAVLQRKKNFLNYIFSAKLLQSDIFRTNNAKRIEFTHDF